jgi:hypothetical protein
MWALQLPSPEECIALSLSRLPHRTECWLVPVYLSAIAIEVQYGQNLGRTKDHWRIGTMFLSAFNIHTI